MNLFFIKLVSLARNCSLWINTAKGTHSILMQQVDLHLHRASSSDAGRSQSDILETSADNAFPCWPTNKQTNIHGLTKNNTGI